MPGPITSRTSSARTRSKPAGYFNFNNNGQQPGWGEALNINFGPNASNPNDTNNQFANMLLGNYTSVSQTRGIYYGSFRAVHHWNCTSRTAGRSTVA